MAATKRREVLSLVSSLGGGPAGGSVRPVLRSADLPAKNELVHLLSRISYGLRHEDLEIARGMGHEAYVDWQLAYQDIDDRALESALAGALPTLSMSLQQLVALAQDPQSRGVPFAELVVATLARAVSSPRQLYEVMVEFWSNHLSVNGSDGLVGLLKAWEDRDVIRRHALGRFVDLLKADARSPAMLVYLDNVSNTKDGPNENYARELLELHTLGVDGGYTEEDVREAARIFTGWTLRPGTGAFTFEPRRHDSGAKTVLGMTFPAGGGIEEGDALLELLAAHPSTALFIAAKLVRRFVADDPPASLVETVASAFTSHGGYIPAVVRTLLLSDEFSAARDVKLKRPFDLAASLLRSTAATVTAAGYRSLFATLGALGHVPFTWPSPDGFPDRAEHWTSSSALLGRWNLALGLADGTLERFYPYDIEPLLDGAATPAEIVAALVERILARPILPEDADSLVAYAAGGKPPSSPLSGRERELSARGVLGLLGTSRYFQLR
jgi:uncharacterized protein (DUF1800 family)